LIAKKPSTYLLFKNIGIRTISLRNIERILIRFRICLGALLEAFLFGIGGMIYEG